MSQLMNMNNSMLLQRSGGGGGALVVAQTGATLGLAEWTVHTMGGTRYSFESADAPGAYLQLVDGKLVVAPLAQSFTNEVFEAHAVPVAGADQATAWPGSTDCFYFQHVASDLYLQISENDHALVLGPTVPGAYAVWKILNQGVKDARSVHLWFNLSEPSDQIYSEVSTAQPATPGSYFVAIGFGDAAQQIPQGYFGIQVRADGVRQAIFSLWGLAPLSDPTKPVPFALTVGDGVTVVPFDGEGEGISARWPVAWTDMKAQRFCLVAKPNATTNPAQPGFGSIQGTALSAYVAIDGAPWKLLATLQAPYGGGQVISKSFYAFCEDFVRNGLVANDTRPRSPWQPRAAMFANTFARGMASRRSPYIDTATYTATTHPMANILAAGESGIHGFYLGTGLQFGVNFATQSFPLPNTVLRTDGVAPAMIDMPPGV